MIQYLVCYDIEDDKARNQAARTLLAHGDRVQKSVFEIQLRDQSEFVALKASLVEMLGEEVNVRLYRLTADAIAKSSDLAGAPIASPPAAIIL